MIWSIWSFFWSAGMVLSFEIVGTPQTIWVSSFIIWRRSSSPSTLDDMSTGYSFYVLQEGHAHPRYVLPRTNHFLAPLFQTSCFSKEREGSKDCWFPLHTHCFTLTSPQKWRIATIGGNASSLEDLQAACTDYVSAVHSVTRLQLLKQRMHYSWFT